MLNARWKRLLPKQHLKRIRNNLGVTLNEDGLPENSLAQRPSILVFR